MMMNGNETCSLLVELFVEELPPKVLEKLGDTFANAIFEEIQYNGLTTEVSVCTSFASPRRLAAHITGVRSSKPVSDKLEKLMPLSVAIKDGAPTLALIKRLEKIGHADLAKLWPDAKKGVDSLLVQSDGKVECVYWRGQDSRLTLEMGLSQALGTSVRKLPIPKMMTYQLESNCSLPGWSSVQFVRPVHKIVALHGADVVPLNLLGLVSGRETEGHRFEARVSPVVIDHADKYEETMLSDGGILASFRRRRDDIKEQLKTTAEKLAGDVHVLNDPDLLDEVTALVERPNVLVCEFDKQFLEIPQECLILTMKANQKYFPLLDRSEKLTHQFLIVSNISPDDPSAVIGGNERVIRPRLADAKFFFDQDRKKTLASRVDGLNKVVYHNRLGSQGDRVDRIRTIARWLAPQFGLDPEQADRAALLAKSDLLTEMVGEFPELQGIMGGYYARHDGEHTEVAQAIADQYLMSPDHRSNKSNMVSSVLVLADRVETLVGIWGVGLKPTGDKDPYALRRHAITLIREFEFLSNTSQIEAASLPFKLNLDTFLAVAWSTFNEFSLAEGTLAELKTFIFDRYLNQLAPKYGVQIVQAVIVQQPPIQEVVKRVSAVTAFVQLREAPSLAAANKRISNILKKITHEHSPVSEALLLEDPEKFLYEAMLTLLPLAEQQFQDGDYIASLGTLAGLREPVDAFFEGVMVNTEDEVLRLNRQGLLRDLHQAMNQVADLSQLAN